MYSMKSRNINSISYKELNNSLFTDIMTHFVYNLENSLNIPINEYKNLNEFSLKDLSQKLREIENRVKDIQSQGNKKEVKDRKIILDQIKIESQSIDKEIDEIINEEKNKIY